ncbi:MAG: vanadium-dependent haloperoxidase [Limisphaerales bacterium]
MDHHRPVLIAFLLCLAAAGPRGRADAVLEWNDLMLDGIRVDTTGPTLATRNLAILAVAMHDAVNSIVRTHQPYQFLPEPPAEAGPEAAAIGAAEEIMKALYPGLAARADELYAVGVASLPATAATTNGLAFGADIGRRTLASREADGANTDVPYIPSNAPGQWRRTPPFFRPPLTPQWRYVKPFAIPDKEPFLPPPPPALDSPEYAADLNEVKAIGGKGSSVRTAYQGETAVFWSDFSYTAMPPGHWNEIAATIARTRTNTLAENARLFALLGLAQGDAAIVCWEAKFRYNFWRPVTAIQRAAEDGNPGTEPDASWDHFLVSPPFPDHTSGHSTFSAASAEVLRQFYGADEITFTVASDSLPGVFRTYTNLAACAEEVGMSRIYGGIHFQSANREGKTSGRKIAQYVLANHLLPNDALPRLACEGATPAGLRLRLHGHAGRGLVLETTGDFAGWTPLATNAVAPGGVALTVPAGNAGGFFRVREIAP